MATTAKRIRVKAGIFMGSGELSTSTSGSNVNMSIISDKRWNTTAALYNHWKAELRRHVPDVGAKVIGSRTGYVDENSPLHRTFTEVGPGVLDVLVTFYEYGDLGGKPVATISTSQFKM